MSESFEGVWLALRERADAEARECATRVFTSALELPPGPVRIVDLGAGSGNNAGYLAPRLEALGVSQQEWWLVDEDAALLARATRRLSDSGIAVHTRRLDLSTALDSDAFEGAALVTASALFDLVSSEWIDHLVRTLLRAGVPALWASLTVNGADAWSPRHAGDDLAMNAFRSDMLRDKGFGPALGTTAPDALVRAIERVGGTALGQDSPWRLGSADARLQLRYLDDVAAVLEGRAEPSWLAFRRREIDAGTSSLSVGHTDVLGLFSVPRSMSKSTSGPSV